MLSHDAINADKQKKERSNASKVMRKFARKLDTLDLLRKRQTTWFVREADHIAHFIHVHKFKFGPCFRVHLGIRVLNDDFESIALNGPDHTQGLEYTDDEASLEVCATAMYDFARIKGEDWFNQQEPSLLASDHSWLTDDTRNLLRYALNGHSNSENVHRSRALLGLGK
ncbi:hypothetical protein [Polycladidibacter hongkongensis]|uniref:hypothetical protein n=1 Tax=Polycladidibacter hongkongensis TaxID=1647556 RepID=UPI0012E35C17|nr:hypothetical protein [Pseudovibrio hongkongensis]